jgi:hypothetical protein
VTTSPRKRMREVVYRGSKLALPSRAKGMSPEQLDAYWRSDARVALSVEELGTPVRTGDMTIEFKPSAHVDYGAMARRRLFDQFGLDPNDPWHWRQLIDFFAYSESWEGPRRKAGRPRATAKDAEDAAMIATSPGQSNVVLAKKLGTHRSRIAKLKKILSSAGT